MNEEVVGSWAWDELEIVEWEDLKPLKEKGYIPYMVLFKEE